MKRILYILMILLPTVASSQVKVYEKEIYFNHDTKEVVVNMMVEAENIQGSVALDFALRDSIGNMYELPSIIYSKSTRRWQIVRSTESLHIYVKEQKHVTTKYSTKVSYAEWMNHASLIVNQVRYEKCGEWFVDTRTIVNDIMVDPYPEVEITSEPIIWKPDPAIYYRMVGFINPEVEGIKYRAAMVQLRINYPVNVYRVMPDYMNNAQELKKVDTLMNVVLNDELINVNSYLITGYASPEGRYSANTKLSQNRSNGFRTYLKQFYKTEKRPITTQWVPEDWEGLAQAINENDVPLKNDIINIINTVSNPDARDAKIKALDKGVTYNNLLKNYYPALRRIELRADYTVRSLSDEEAKEVIYKRPELLSLDEMYRVAKLYKPGTKEYREVYEIAAQHFPKDVIANNNAAAAILLNDDAEAAKVYLDKIKDDKRSYINRGVLAYIEGDLKSAKEYFRVAAEAGYEAAKINIELLENTQK